MIRTPIPERISPSALQALVDFEALWSASVRRAARKKSLTPMLDEYRNRSR